MDGRSAMRASKTVVPGGSLSMEEGGMALESGEQYKCGMVLLSEVGSPGARI